ncbi:Hypothetical protein Minf_1385 [Methylacidiphilum infernorum V4]|uniref:Uncharacterized protein n=1 Tax=Methylacidiphilum infernorum (isolate V4) TaxID=481448 RepID=B3DVT6_METI4|nr:Hypothetical protein Minf_1385 [Methylacidiphilum infernorum V4]
MREADILNFWARIAERIASPIHKQAKNQLYSMKKKFLSVYRIKKQWPGNNSFYKKRRIFPRTGMPSSIATQFY